MAAQESASDDVRVTVENVGGIDRSEVSFSSGVTVLTGRNATNRTSFLQALMAALGSDDVSLKADADRGEVELRIGDERYTRTLVRRNGTVEMGGDPYLDDQTAADLFAFLLESNEARRAVVRDDDLRDVIMRPIDTAAIREEIDRLTDERAAVRSKLDDLESAKRRRTELEGRRAELRETIAAKRETLEELRAELEEADATFEGVKQERERLERTLDELNEVRSELEDVRYELETERESIEALEDEIEEKRAELDAMPETSADRIDEVRGDIQRLRGREDELESTLNRLRSVVQFNEEALNGMDGDLASDLDPTGTAEGTGGDAVTDQLVDDTVTCWTCGTVVERTRIDETLDDLRDLRSEKRQERNEVRAEIRELESEKSRLEEERERRERLTARIDRAESEVDDRRSRIDDLEARRDDLRDRLDDLEATVDEFGDLEHGDVLDRHKEANQLEFELERLESELEEVEAELDRIDDRLAEEPDLRTRLDRIGSELERLRTRIDRVEREAVENFNEHMDEVLDVLNYENIERIWIERREVEAREGRRKTTKSVFDLHVVRQDGTGAAYEDTVDHLSESEREVTGLVFALAGYLVHDLHEEVPFMLLDSLEAVDADRIAAVVDYFEEHTRNLVLALLTEDAAALDDAYQRVDTI